MSQSARDVQLTELKDMISQLNNTVNSQNKTMEAMTAMIAEKDQRIAELTEELKLLRKKLFGSSKERTAFKPTSDQLNMLAELGLEPEPEPELIDVEFIDVKAHKKAKKPKTTFEEQFKGLEIKKVLVDTLSDEDKACPVCGTEMKPIGTEHIRYEVIHVRPKMYAIEYIATTYECPECKKGIELQFIKDNGAPSALIEGSYVSSSLAAWVFYQKFVMSVPFYRQERSFEELGALINRTTMANWAEKCFEMYFAPLYNYFHRQILKRMFLMMDETPIQVLREPDKTPESKSYVWLLRTGDDGLPPMVYYHYSPTRSGDTAVELTMGIKPGTYFMCDGFSGYNKLKGLVKRCTCYAHIRRYFYEAIPKGHGNDITNPAVQGVLYCNKLFEYERKYAESGCSYETRRKRRLKDEKPVIESFIAWAERQPVSGNGKFSKAVTYLLNRREYMMTYLEDGRCSLSNNWSLCEQSTYPHLYAKVAANTAFRTKLCG